MMDPVSYIPLPSVPVGPSPVSPESVISSDDTINIVVIERPEQIITGNHNWGVYCVFLVIIICIICAVLYSLTHLTDPKN